MSKNAYVGINDVARKITKMYVGVSGVARKITKAYVGVGGVARLFFSDGGGGAIYSSITDFEKSSTHYNYFCVTHTQDYVIVSGGRNDQSANPLKTTTAYNINLVTTACPDLPTQSSYQGNMACGGYGIIASGKSGSSGSSRTAQCIAYNNTLTRTALSDVTQSVFEMATASNDTHCILGYGSYYSGQSGKMQSYSSSLVKTSLNDTTIHRRGQAGANLGNSYLIFCGGNIDANSVDTEFYDNNNVKTTGNYPYGTAGYKWYPKGIGLKNHALFCWSSDVEGGSTIQYSDTIIAYDTNLVSTSFSTSESSARGQGFSIKGDYAVISMGGNRTVSGTGTYGENLCYGYIYDDNLVLVDTIETVRASSQPCFADANSSFGILFGGAYNYATQIVF